MEFDVANLLPLQCLFADVCVGIARGVNCAAKCLTRKAATGIVTRTSDGQMGAAMENNLISATEPTQRSAEFFRIILSELPFNAPLNPDTVSHARTNSWQLT